MLMNYESFKNAVEETFKDYLPEHFQNMEIKMIPINKINGINDGLIVTDSSQGGKQISPVLNINDMYEAYVHIMDLQDVLGMAAACMVMGHTAEVRELDFETAKDNIVFQLINTACNEEMLRGIPHREFLDLSIIYRWVISTDEGVTSVIIHNGLAQELKMEEQDLFSCAVKNTHRVFPISIDEMGELMKRKRMKVEFLYFKITQKDDDVLYKKISEIPEDEMLYVITNTEWFNGACSILYENNIHELAMKLGTDLYILPSSIHECIALPVDVIGLHEAADMAKRANRYAVSDNEQLSDRVYYYNKDTRIFTLAIDKD